MHMQQEQPTAPSSTATTEHHHHHHHNNNTLIIHGNTNQTLLNPKALSIQSDTTQTFLQIAPAPNFSLKSILARTSHLQGGRRGGVEGGRNEDKTERKQRHSENDLEKKKKSTQS